ncbi:SURF1 family protein [Acidovorax sp. SUPP950]|uniref:SURF1 family protein n=1 Tax=Acidovorax sp. SUPP950 TaxID=511901 RepID=UPI0024E0EC28|nr:SURF1 family protein [Acidovorax sp. SUPP950]
MTSARRRLGLQFWLVSLAAVLAMAATASLGRWQLSRAAQKEALQAAIDARSARPPLEGATLAALPAATGPDDPLVHRRIVLRGRWLSAHTVFLDNRQMQGRPGFFVLTPLQLQGSATSVLVQRGWVPRNFQDRTQLPQIPAPVGYTEVEGRIAAAPSRLYEVGATGSAEGSSRIRQNLDLAAYRGETGLALAPLTVLQTGGASDGLLRDWPVIDAGVEKHYGYAVQWFGLCGLVAILYVWFQIVRRFLRPRRQPAA